MTAKTSRKRFSTVMSKVAFDGDTLEITGRFGVAAVALLVMTGVTGWGALLGDDLPIPVRLIMGVGLLICAYGVVDTLLGKAHLRYSKRRRTLDVLRKSPFATARYRGPVTGPVKVQVSRVASSRSSGSVQLYQVVFAVTLPDAFVRFPLEAASLRGEVAVQRVAAWEHKLGLDEDTTASDQTAPQARGPVPADSPVNKA